MLGMENFFIFLMFVNMDGRMEQNELRKFLTTNSVQDIILLSILVLNYLTTRTILIGMAD